MIPLPHPALLFMLALQVLVEREVETLHFEHRSGSPEKTYILETMGSGVAVFDYDGDGALDVYLVNAGDVTPELEGASNRLFRNEGRWRFRDVTERAGLVEAGYGQGVAVADVDNDGDTDVLVTNYGANALYVNRGDGTFVARDVGVEDGRWSTSAAFADVDGDGFVDLYVASYLEFDRELLDRLVPRRWCEWKGLPVNCGPRGFPHAAGAFYRNRGDGTFEERTAEAGLARSDTYQLGVSFADVDGDGDADLYVATDSTPNLLFVNRGDGSFDDHSLLSGAALSHLGSEQAGMGVDAGDVDGDGDADLVITNFSDDYNVLYRNLDDGRFEDASDVAGLAVASLSYLGWSVFLEDFDGDVDLDLLVVNGHVYPQVESVTARVGESFAQPVQLFSNDGRGHFAEATAPGPVLPARGAALGDLDGDGDGDVDVVVTVLGDRPVVLENLSAGDRMARLTLVGRTANRDATGARLVFGSGGSRDVRSARGYLSASASTIHIPVAGPTDVEVTWPGGEPVLMNLDGPGRYVVLESHQEPLPIGARP